ncbi:sugar-binding transcriptional regulator [Anoxynatronum sibiricum]|uniref:Sugar-binding domain-containing protein n=1 Tax=Anoxynatronum sibiricum TaxID=210623 RepID=A0ABU9VRN6_9CLOT
MKELLDLQKIIVPEMLTLMEKRYHILRNIAVWQPIGRRLLAGKLQIGERIVRKEISFLQLQGLLDVEAGGMTVTPEGREVIQKLKESIYQLRGIRHLQDSLQKKLGIRNAYVVSGNLEEEEYVLNDMAKVASMQLQQTLEDDMVLGITGGSTMAAVAEVLTQMRKMEHVTVVPARGGFGREVEKQANTVVAQIARKLGARYMLLHASDTLSKEALQSVLNDPAIKKVVETIKTTRCLVFGIGRADEMARRREFSQDQIDMLSRQRAVAESFGFYFTREGTIVHEIETLGINFNDFLKMEHAIGVAGGARKAEAIFTIARLKPSMVLVTDEAAAMEIMKHF